MRRSALFGLVVGLLTTVVVAVGAGPAAAHICPLQAPIPVGKPATIHVTAPVEQKPVGDIEFLAPTGLRVDRADPLPGWQAKTTGSSVRYRGGPSPPYSCPTFSIGVTASARGVFGITVVQRGADGKVISRATFDPPDPIFQPVVYAGVDPPTSRGSGSILTRIGVALVVVGVIAVIVVFVLFVRGRRRAADDDDLAARVAAVKKQTRG